MSMIDETPIDDTLASWAKANGKRSKVHWFDWGIGEPAFCGARVRHCPDFQFHSAAEIGRTATLCERCEGGLAAEARLYRGQRRPGHN